MSSDTGGITGGGAIWGMLFIAAVMLLPLLCSAQTGDAERDSALAREYRRLVTASEEHDSLLSAENRAQVQRLTEEYDSDRKTEELALLEKEKQRNELELAARGALLEQRQQEKREKERDIRRLQQEQDIRTLELDSARSHLAIRDVQLARQKEEHVRGQDALAVQEAGLQRERTWRGIAGAGLLAVLLFLGSGYWSFRNRRTAAALREQAATDRARMLEARVFAEAAAAERRQKEAQQEFAARLIVAQEDERNRIAGALHDGISQDLIITKFRAAMAMKDGREAETHMKEILDTVSDSIEEVRRMSRDLRPTQLERVGLTATLGSMLRGVEESTELTVDAHIDTVDGLLSADGEIGLYRIAQEAVNNILKHADASKAELQLQKDGDSLRLVVHDDGKGFDTETTVQDGTGGGLGLRGIRERAHMLGGMLRIESAPGKGTTLWLEFPLQETAEEGGVS
jgi:signal transduction histidine kinase